MDLFPTSSSADSIAFLFLELVAWFLFEAVAVAFDVARLDTYLYGDEWVSFTFLRVLDNISFGDMLKD